MPGDAMALTEQLCRFARDRIGLKPELALPKIEAMLRAVAEVDRPSFARSVLSSDGESAPFRAFAEALLVHETYFFRHPDQLRLLADELLPQLLRRRLDAGSRDLHIWCAGCSSGEEVYTLALILQAAIAGSPLPSVRAWNATVLGTDLSALSLEQAERGEYSVAPGLHSFRDVPEPARRHFPAIFSGADATWSASPELRRQVRFRRHNLVTDPPPLENADVILCRNTLIYFDEEQTRAAIASLESALRMSGVLILGPAEMPRDAPSLRMTCTEQAVFWTKQGGAP